MEARRTVKPATKKSAGPDSAWYGPDRPKVSWSLTQSRCSYLRNTENASSARPARMQEQ